MTFIHRSLVLCFISLFLVFAFSPAFSDDKPAIDHRRFVDLVIQELEKTSDDDLMAFVEWVSALREINGQYATYRLSEHLERRFGPNADFLLKPFLNDFDPRKKPTFNLEELLRNPAYGEKLKKLIESEGYALRVKKEGTESVMTGLREGSPVRPLPEFEGGEEAREVEVAKQAETEPALKQGKLGIQFNYRFECDDDEIGECQDLLGKQKLPGERGLFSFFNDTAFAFAYDTYEEVFDAMIKKLTDDFSLSKPIRKYITHTADQKEEFIDVTVKTTFHVSLPHNGLDSADFVSRMNQALDEFEEEHSNDWIRIGVEFIESAPVENDKTMLEKEEIESLKLLSNAKRWEEEWLALDGLVSAPITSDLRDQLIRLLESTTVDRVKRRAALILAKEPSVFTNEETVKLIGPVLSSISNEEFQVLISSVPRVEKLFVLHLLKNKTSHARKLIELFILQNPDDIDQIAEVFKASWCPLRYSDCSGHNVVNCLKDGSCSYRCYLYEFDTQEFEGAASSENYRSYLPLRESHHYHFQVMVARIFGKFGKRKDIVDILSLIDSPAPFVKQEAEKAIAAMRERR